MPCALETGVVKRSDPPRPRARAWRRRAREALLGDAIASVGVFTGDVISRDAHDGRDSVQSSAEGTRLCSVLVVIMRYLESGIRDERRATAVR